MLTSGLASHIRDTKSELDRPILYSANPPASDCSYPICCKHLHGIGPDSPTNKWGHTLLDQATVVDQDFPLG
jgi:hypothetical protein